MMAIAADAKSNISVSMSGGDNSNSMVRPTLQERKGLSSRMVTSYASIPSNEDSKALRNSNSEQGLSHFEKQVSSLGYKRTEVAPKSEWNRDASAPKRLNALSKSKSPSRPGVQRRRSFGDDFHSLHKAAATVVENQRLSTDSDLDELSVHEGNDSNTNGYSFIPNALSPPSFVSKSQETSSSSSSRSSEMSPSDLFTRAAAVAGRKFAAASPASSTDLSAPTAVPFGQKLSARDSSSPHLLNIPNPVQEEAYRRQSDSTMDINANSNKSMNNAVISTSQTSTMNRHRSRCLITNETVVQHSNDEQNDEEKRKALFRKDFRGEPIPSDAILFRLYGNIHVPPPPPPPPPPFHNSPDEQGSSSNRSMGTPTGNLSKKHVLRAPDLSPKDLPKSSDGMVDISFASETYGKAWKDSTHKSMRKRNPNDDSRISESSKSKRSISSGRRSSSKSRLDADRSYSRSHSGNRTPIQKGLHGSRSKADVGGNEEKVPKSKGNRRRDGMAHSTNGRDHESPKSKNRKGVETMKIRSKHAHEKSLTDGASPSSYGSDYDAFQALLNLSDGGFFDSSDESPEFKTSESLEFLRRSLPSMNSAPKMHCLFNDSVNSCSSFAEGDEKADKKRKKKGKGKRAGVKGKSRSRSADENRNTSSKSRRGKRSSKTNVSNIDPKPIDDKKSLHASWYYPLSTTGSERGPERGKQHQSPRVITKKSSCNETSSKQRKNSKSPKFHNKKELNTGPERGKQHQSPRVVTRKSSCDETSSKQRKNSKSPKFHNEKELNSGSPGSLSRRERIKRPNSSKSMTAVSQSQGDVDPSLEQGSTKSRSTHQDNAFEYVPKHGVSKIAAKEEKKTEDDEFCNFPLSSWDDKLVESKRITAEDIIASVRDILVSPKMLIRKDLVGKSRWKTEASPMMNAISPRSNCDSAAAKVPRFDAMPIPFVDEPAPPSPPPPTTPPQSPKKLDFPLDFMEYQNISPLTIASKKVGLESQLLSAHNYLEI